MLEERWETKKQKCRGWELCEDKTQEKKSLKKFQRILKGILFHFDGPKPDVGD